MKKRIFLIFSLFVFLLAGCSGTQPVQNSQSTEYMVSDEKSENIIDTDLIDIVTTEKIMELEDGLSAVRHEGDYGFDEFLSGGGASSDKEVIGFLTENLLGGLELESVNEMFGCSTVTVRNAEGEVLFGRNFDWNSCDAMVVLSYPEKAYASVSTVNMDFIRQGAENMTGLALKTDEVMMIAALYAPLDGMNEKGLAVSVNMIQDSATINQDTEKPDITTTTAIRLLLDKAGTVEESLELLKQYDMHSSMGMMVHLAVADASGESAVVEYIGNEMVVTETFTIFAWFVGRKIGTDRLTTLFAD